MSRTIESARKTRRALFVSAGMSCVGLGTLGVFVPGLPTTVFLLLASYFFARSSPRLHRKLIEHPRLGPYLTAVRERAMPLRAKVISLVAMWIGITISCLALADRGWALPALMVALGSIGTTMILFYLRTLPAASASPVAIRRT